MPLTYSPYQAVATGFADYRHQRQNTLTTAITAAERGAFEYLPKPFDLGELTGVVVRAMELPRTQADIGDTSGDEDQNLPLVGRSPAMQEIYRTVARLTQNDLSVLVTGDSGTGKELLRAPA